MSQQVNDVEFAANGWAAVPRSFIKSLVEVDKNKQAEMKVTEAVPPSSNLARKTQEFARQQLPVQTFNHFMRVWY
jgi:cyanamide hydratase